jgi:hypothetical protein
MTPKGNIQINANGNTLANYSLIIDDTGKLNNMNSKPLPYTILSGELIAHNNSKIIDGVGTLFTKELVPGDIITLDIANAIDFVVISIQSDTQMTIDQCGYNGVEVDKPYQSVLRRPNIYAFFDNGDNIKGHIDNYGNMVIGSSEASTMFEIAGTSNNSVNIPAITLTNTSIEDGQYNRSTYINFRGYNSGNPLSDPVRLGHIEVGHNGILTDNKGIMRFFTNTGTLTGETNALSINHNGHIGIGGQNEPLAIMHIQDTNTTSNNCTIILESNTEFSPLIGNSIFDERGDIAFAGHTSINETLTPNMYKRYLATISGSNDSNNKILKGRLDFCTIDNDYSNGIEPRMTIDHLGYTGIGIIRPQNILHVSPELRLINKSFNYISTISLNGGNTQITVNNNIFSGFTDADKKILIGGIAVIGEPTLLTPGILSIDSINQFTVSGNIITYLTPYIGCKIYIQYAGLNVEPNKGYVGINTITPYTPLSVNGAITTSIFTTTSNITLDATHFTIICNTTSSTIGITLPENNPSVIGRIYKIKNASSSGNPVYISAEDTSLIDGNSTYTLNYSSGIMGFNTFQSDGINWWIVG